MEDKGISKRVLIKFLIIAVIGLGAFLVPIQYNGSTNIVVGVFTSLVERVLSPFIDELILVLLAISVIGSGVDYVLGKMGRVLEGRWHELFKITGVYLITKVFALVMASCFYLGKGPDITGEMVALAKTLVALALSLSYLLPFLTDGGLMEFVGELAKPFVQPLFRVPSDAALDLLASWMGASSAAVILSSDKYKKGFYTKREAANVMCNFSLVSIPFCLVIVTTAKVEQYFPYIYGLLCLLGILLAVVLSRIYPLNRLEDTYFVKRRETVEAAGETSMLRRAVMNGCHTAETFSIPKVLVSGTDVMLNICINLVPLVIGWGILGLALVYYTPVLNWLAMPMGALLHLFGVEDAFLVAPATLAGFVDMFIPAMLITGVESVRTRFIIATLSLIQIIYITEVGSVILKTDLGVDLKRLVIIFLERTLISLPIIVLASKLIV